MAAAFDALEDPARFPELLDTTRPRTESTAEPGGAARRRSPSPPRPPPTQAAIAGLYLAVAAAIAGEQEQAIQIIAQAFAWDPTNRSTWIVRLTGLAATQPSVLPLIAALATGSDDGAH